VSCNHLVCYREGCADCCSCGVNVLSALLQDNQDTQATQATRTPLTPHNEAQCIAESVQTNQVGDMIKDLGTGHYCTTIIGSNICVECGKTTGQKDELIERLRNLDSSLRIESALAAPYHAPMGESIIDQVIQELAQARQELSFERAANKILEKRFKERIKELEGEVERCSKLYVDECKAHDKAKSDVMQNIYQSNRYRTALEKIAKNYCAHPDELKQSRIEIALEALGKDGGGNG
jgi:hypothetical protein